MNPNIGYHTRLRTNNTIKAAGGCFGGAFSLDTANRLVKAMFTVKVLPSGHPVFVDRQGREVSLYMTVDPATTEAGKAALVEYRKTQEIQRRADEAKAARVQALLDSMTDDEILNKLGES